MLISITTARIIANTSTAGEAMRSVVSPLVYTLSILAGLVCVAFLINAGFHYITSSGHPEKLAHAKKIMRDALIGLIIVLSAAVLTTILSNAYGNPGASPAAQLPTLTTIEPTSSSLSLVDVLTKAITGLLQNIIESIGKPFIGALKYFTSSTPLMAENSSVFNLWLALVAMADALFVLIISLLGFQVMGASTLGMEELDFKHLLPRMALAFLLINSSIFAIDAVISLSNSMISVLNTAFGDLSVWNILSDIVSQTSAMGLAALLIMIVFLVLTFILLVYYVGRLVTLYLGAVLAPLLLLLWLLPSFKDFASAAIKTYISTIFVLFVHVVILLLAGSLLATLVESSPGGTPDPIMSLIVGMATLIALIKTQGVLAQLNYVSVGPKSLRKLSSLFVSSVSRITSPSLG